MDMVRIDSFDIATMVHKCIGNIKPNGKAEHDIQTLDNLKAYIDVVDNLIRDIKILSFDAKHECGSIANIGCYSLSYLARLRDEISALLDSRWE